MHESLIPEIDRQGSEAAGDLLRAIKDDVTPMPLLNPLITPPIHIPTVDHLLLKPNSGDAAETSTKPTPTTRVE